MLTHTARERARERHPHTHIYIYIEVPAHITVKGTQTLDDV